MAWKMDKKFGPGYPIVAGHRGFSTLYPENTMIAFVEAAKLGVDMIELDIAMTKDGIPMLYHDSTLDEKSTPLTGEFSDYTFEELKQVRIGAKLGMEDQPLASLEDFCQAFLAYPGICVNVDLKPGTNVSAVMAVLEKYGYLDRCIFNSLDGNITRYLRDNTDFLIVGPPLGCIWGVNQIPGPDGTYRLFDSVCLDPEDITPENIAIIRSHGKIPMGAGVSDEELTDICVNSGCEIALCDDPRPLLRKMGRLNS